MDGVPRDLQPLVDSWHHFPGARRTALSLSTAGRGAEADGDLAVRRHREPYDLGVDMQQPRGKHVPVLLDRCLDLLAPALTRRGARHVDATLGLGGHAEAVLQRHPHIVLIGLDRDTEALALATRRLAAYADRVHLIHAVYDELPEILERLGVPAIDSILFDLGVS